MGGRLIARLKVAISRFVNLANSSESDCPNSNRLSASLCVAAKIGVKDSPRSDVGDGNLKVIFVKGLELEMFIFCDDYTRY